MEKNKVNTNFQGNKFPKENASDKYLSFLMLHYIIRVNKKYYLFKKFNQTILKEC